MHEEHKLNNLTNPEENDKKNPSINHIVYPLENVCFGQPGHRFILLIKVIAII